MSPEPGATSSGAVTPQQIAARIGHQLQVAPHATPGGRRFSRRAGTQVQELGISPAEVDATLDHPFSTEPTHQHNGTLFVRGTLGVIVPLDDPCMVVALFRVDATAQPKPRARRAGGGPSRAVPDSFTECERMLRSHGFEIATSGAHGKATHPDHPGVTITLPHTPSDHRSWANLTADIRRRTGIDIARHS